MDIDTGSFNTLYDGKQDETYRLRNASGPTSPILPYVALEHVSIFAKHEGSHAPLKMLVKRGNETIYRSFGSLKPREVKIEGVPECPSH